MGANWNSKKTWAVKFLFHNPKVFQNSNGDKSYPDNTSNTKIFKTQNTFFLHNWKGLLWFKFIKSKCSFMHSKSFKQKEQEVLVLAWKLTVFIESTFTINIIWIKAIFFSKKCIYTFCVTEKLFYDLNLLKIMQLYAQVNALNKKIEKFLLVWKLIQIVFIEWTFKININWINPYI